MQIKEIQLSKEKIQFIQRFGIFYEDNGVPRIGGKIFGLLLVYDNPISAGQMAQVLKVSKGSVSTNIRLLVSAGFIDRVSIPGDRKDYYIISDKAWENAFKAKIEACESMISLIKQGISAFPDDDKSSIKLYQMIEWVTEVHNAFAQVRSNWIQNNQT